MIGGGKDNLVKIDFKRQKPTGLNIRPTISEKCYHFKKDLNTDSRTATCASCGACLDLFQLLYEISQDESWITSKLVRAEEQTNDLADKIKLAKKELKSLNDKIKRRQRKCKFKE